MPYWADNIIRYIVDLGSSVVLPIVIAILSIIFGVKIGKAIRSGLMMGVGFVGVNMITGLLEDNLEPAARAMSERFGLSLEVIDLGWTGTSSMAWASGIAITAIPVAIGVNVIMLLLRLTRTVNIDIWNIWHMTFTGAVVYALTGNYVLGLLGVVAHAAFTYKLGDLWAPLMTDYFALDGLTCPHGTSAIMAPYACFVDALLDRIPGIRRININADVLQDKAGVLAEPVVLGAVLGSTLGFLAGYGPQKALQLGISMAAVMVLMPKIVKCIMDGLTPLTEKARERMKNKFHGASYHLGIDPAVLLGDPQVVEAGLIFIPLTLLIAAVMPGNRILPFGDLASISFFIGIAVAVHKGNLFRTLISGSLIMTVTIWIANRTIPWLTALGRQTGTTGGREIAALDQGGNPVTYIYTQIVTGQDWKGLAAVGLTYAVMVAFSVRMSRNRASEMKNEAAEDSGK